MMKRKFLIFSFLHFFIATAVAQVGEYRTDLAVGALKFLRGIFLIVDFGKTNSTVFERACEVYDPRD